MATTISVNEFNGEPIELYVRDTGPCAGPAIVLCHGFPDLGTTWTHQIEVLDAAGYRAIAPDQFLVNLASMCVFPFAARPMLSALLGFHTDSWDRFLDARRVELPRFILNALRP